jgi:hypothetical protein
MRDHLREEHGGIDALLDQAAEACNRRLRADRKRAARDASESGADPKPLAAFSLGLRVYTLRQTQKLFWEMPGWDGLEEGLGLAIDAIRANLVALADEIQPTVYREMKAALARLTELNGRLIAKADASVTFRTGDCLPPVVPGKELWEGLRSLAQRALPAGGPLGGWAALGGALGKCQLTWYERVDGDPLPDLEPLVQRAQELPKKQVARVPVVQRFVKLAAQLPALGQRAFLERVSGSAAEHKGYGPDGDGFVIPRLLDALARTVLEDLETLPRTVTTAGGGAAAAASQTSYLGLELIPQRYEIRKGSRKRVSLAGRARLWELLTVLHTAGGNYCDIKVLLREAWSGYCVEMGTVHSMVSHLRGVLKPLGVGIVYKRPLGYRLEALRP